MKCLSPTGSSINYNSTISDKQKQMERENKGSKGNGEWRKWVEKERW